VLTGGEPVTARIAVRPAARSDLARLLAIESRAFTSDRLTPRAFRHLLTRARADCLVAVGWAASAPLLPDAPQEIAGYAAILYRATARVARLHSLAVDPSRRRGGTGTVLLAAAEQAAAARGSAVLRLAVRTDNLAGIRLYRSHGYTELGTEQAYYTDGMSALSMEKVLAVA
jgi:ribosomal protein S18 acetylase RimI-like enzyme